MKYIKTYENYDNDIKIGDTVFYKEYGANYHKSGVVIAIDKKDENNPKLGILYTLKKKSKQRFDKKVYKYFNHVFKK